MRTQVNIMPESTQAIQKVSLIKNSPYINMVANILSLVKFIFHSVEELLCCPIAHLAVQSKAAPLQIHSEVSTAIFDRCGDALFVDSIAHTNNHHAPPY